MQPLQLRISDFIKGQYGVVAVLISYGALLGKVNPQQMMMIVIVNVTAYCANKFLCVDYRGGVDNTGSLYTTHIFGAAFGLGCAMIVSGKRLAENPDNSPRYQSNNYAILGSLFMFVTYPSFNSYWAPSVLRVFVATGTFAAPEKRSCRHETCKGHRVLNPVNLLCACLRPGNNKTGLF